MCFSLHQQVLNLKKDKRYKNIQCPEGDNKISYIRHCFHSTWLIVRFLNTKQNQLVYSSEIGIKNYRWINNHLIEIEQDLKASEESIFLNVLSLEEYRIEKEDREEFLEKFLN